MQHWTHDRRESEGRLLKCKIPDWYPIGADIADVLIAMRKEWLSHRDEMLGFQKECGKNGDREGAKFFKQEATDALKHYRAVCLLLPWFALDLPGDCPLIEPYQWPPDLYRHIDMALLVAEYRPSVSVQQEGGE